MGLFDEAACVAVTGAGRGFGRALSVALAQRLCPGSHLLLLGRNRLTLDQTRHEVNRANGQLTVHVFSDYDCSSLNEQKLAAFLGNARQAVASNKVSKLLLVHNAGTISDPSVPCLRYSYDEASAYMNVNLAAMLATNSAFMESFAGFERHVVQISSLCGLKPFKSLGLYSAGKAARNACMKVLADENSDIRVLNYAPGPLKTDMYNQIRDGSHAADIKQAYQDMQPLEPSDSARKLVKILEANAYESGAHVDYYDVE